MKVSTEIDNNFGYEKITQLVDNIPLKIRSRGGGGLTFRRVIYFIIQITNKHKLFGFPIFRE